MSDRKKYEHTLNMRINLWRKSLKLHFKIFYTLYHRRKTIVCCLFTYTWSVKKCERYYVGLISNIAFSKTFINLAQKKPAEMAPSHFARTPEHFRASSVKFYIVKAINWSPTFLISHPMKIQFNFWNIIISDSEKTTRMFMWISIQNSIYYTFLFKVFLKREKTGLWRYFANLFSS